jgi:hypothetical protein
MSKIYLLGMVSLLILGMTGSVSYANGVTEKSDSMTFNSMDLIGAPVQDQEGHPIGVITMLQIDSGGRALAIINHGDHDKYGEGGRLTPVPFDALKLSGETGKVDVVLNIDEDQLEAAPFFDPTKSDSRYAGDVYRHYGIQPSWGDTECIYWDDSTWSNLIR